MRLYLMCICSSIGQQVTGKRLLLSAIDFNAVSRNFQIIANGCRLPHHWDARSGSCRLGYPPFINASPLKTAYSKLCPWHRLLQEISGCLVDVLGCLTFQELRSPSHWHLLISPYHGIEILGRSTTLRRKERICQTWFSMYRRFIQLDRKNVLETLTEATSDSEDERMKTPGAKTVTLSVRSCPRHLLPPSSASQTVAYVWHDNSTLSAILTSLAISSRYYLNASGNDNLQSFSWKYVPIEKFQWHFLSPSIGL